MNFYNILIVSVNPETKQEKVIGQIAVSNLLIAQIVKDTLKKDSSFPIYNKVVIHDPNGREIMGD